MRERRQLAVIRSSCSSVPAARATGRHTEMNVISFGVALAISPLLRLLNHRLYATGGG